MNTRYLDSYVAFLKKFLCVKRPLRVVFDCSNGMTGPVLRSLLETHQLINGKLINSKPDGRFPAHGPDPFAEGAADDLARAVRRARADLGVIFDADGDRVFFLDDAGRTIHPDAIAGLIGSAARGPVLLDIRNGYLAQELLKAAGRPMRYSRVGHYFIKKRMRKERIPFAAEFSGHYYFQDFFYCDSGIFAAIQVMNIVSRTPQKVSAWIDSLPRYFSSGEVNFKIRDKGEAMERILRAYRGRARRVSRLDGLKMEFGPSASSGQVPRRASHSAAPRSGAKEWWLLVRPSNTEDLLRVTLEAKRETVFKEALRGVRRLMRQSS